MGRGADGGEGRNVCYSAKRRIVFHTRRLYRASPLSLFLSFSLGSPPLFHSFTRPRPVPLCKSMAICTNSCRTLVNWTVHDFLNVNYFFYVVSLSLSLSICIPVPRSPAACLSRLFVSRGYTIILWRVLSREGIKSRGFAAKRVHWKSDRPPRRLEDEVLLLHRSVRRKSRSARFS